MNTELNKIKQTQQEIKEMLEEQKGSVNHERWYTNDDLIELLKVSRRTLSTWRDQGLIGFSQIGSKIYYSQSDVEQFMKNHYRKPFNKGRSAA